MRNRDESKLLVYDQGAIEEDVYFNLDNHLPKNSLLIFNNTRVVQARLLLKRSTGSRIELFCLEPDKRYTDITTALNQKQKVYWKCLVGGAKKWKGEALIKNILDQAQTIELQARKINKQHDHFLIEFSWNADDISFGDILHLAGAVPLPPYLSREAEETDKETYQTIYAKHDGSVAAPTAGLHFTERVFTKLKAKQIQTAFITLHVGAGTFKPVKDDIVSHDMHSEFFSVHKQLIENLIKNLGNNIIAVGTTSLRAIESLYWIGVKISQGAIDKLSISQWEAYELPQHISAHDALQNVLDWMNANNIENLTATTRLLIAPGYQLRVGNAIFTNFHQPRSTLLLLVAAVAGKEWKSIYNYALHHQFRFLSYGDGCLIWHHRLKNNPLLSPAAYPQ